MQNEPTDPQVELREHIEKALHVDWAFKDKNTKPDKIVILGYPKECGYYLSYEDFVGRVVELLTTERERAFELGKKVEAENCVDYTIQICQQLQGAISRVGREHENEGEGKVVDSLQNAKNIIQEHLTAEQVRKEPRYFHALSKNVTYEEALKKAPDAK